MKISLLINIFINSELKLNHFKLTFSDICNIFDDIHIKIRGSFKIECINFVKETYKKKLFFYQDLTERDWLEASSEINSNINSDFIFLFNEDHIRICDKNILLETIEEIKKFKIDYISYSFFKANRLNTFNLLPLKPQQKEFINFFKINKSKLKLIGKISPSYYHISVIGIFSKRYFSYLVNYENFRFQFYLPTLNKIIERIFIGKKLYILEKLNFIFNKLNINLNNWPINTPFNFEKIWYQDLNYRGNWIYGVPKYELFTNYDDDNGAYGESLIKRGLYPYNKFYLKPQINENDLLSELFVELKKGDQYNLTYYNGKDRISICPVLKIELISGNINLNSSNNRLTIRKKNIYIIYSNLSPILTANTDCRIKISVYDEC